jgi:hypothetical protein
MRLFHRERSGRSTSNQNQQKADKAVTKSNEEHEKQRRNQRSHGD